MNYTPRVLYDVYEREKKVPHLVTIKEVMKLTGVCQGTVSRAVMTGYLIDGRYRVEEAWTGGDRDYSEQETRRRFGNKNYDQWKQMNQRYGRKPCQSGQN